MTTSSDDPLLDAPQRQMEDHLQSTELPPTESICPECLARVPAVRVREGTDIYLAKTCPDHGSFKTVIWRGPPHYSTWLRDKPPNNPIFTQTVAERGCPLDCGLCTEHRQQTCCVLLEVTTRCNLGCPICFASSGGLQVPDPSMDTINGWYRLLRESVGSCNIQLSGGEPTMRDDLPEIITMGRDMGFSYFQLNTNGLRLASEPGYADRLKQAGLSTVFLQFDGLDDHVYQITRGRALFRQKEAAIARCAEAGLGVVLVPTLIPGVNLDEIGRIIDYAVQRLPAVRGVHFQPMSYFGRYPQAPGDADRYTLPELMRDIQTQTGGLIPLDSFRPSCCEHSLCSFHGDYVLLEDGSIRSLAAPASAATDAAEAAGTTAGKSGAAEPPTGGSASSCCCRGRTAIQNPAEKKRTHVARRWSLTGSSSEACSPAGGSDGGARSGAGSATDSGEDHGNDASSGTTAAGTTTGGTTAAGATTLDSFLDRLRNYSFTITAMAFQDVWNLDLERLRNCCLHVVGPSGKIIPFCAYNLTNAAGVPVHRPSTPQTAAHAPQTPTRGPQPAARAPWAATFGQAGSQARPGAGLEAGLESGLEARPSTSPPI